MIDALTGCSWVVDVPFAVLHRLHEMCDGCRLYVIVHSVAYVAYHGTVAFLTALRLLFNIVDFAA
jgi:hypothetical protein